MSSKDEEKFIRLMRAAASVERPAAEMPFGFDTRVLAAAKAKDVDAGEGLGFVAWRAALAAFAVIVLSLTAAYKQDAEDESYLGAPTGYAMADTAIDNAMP